MKVQISQALKQYALQFADLYHSFKVHSEKLQKTKYRIYSSLEYYKKTGMIQLSYNDKPGDLLPPLIIPEIKKTSDILAGLHPIDVNSINDLYYLPQDKISNLIINENKILVINQNGQFSEYDINDEYNHDNLASKRISFLIGYMQAEKLMREAYLVEHQEYRIIRDNITSLEILNTRTGGKFLKNPCDILFSNDYKFYSKQDVGKIGYICGQMSKI